MELGLSQPDYLVAIGRWAGIFNMKPVVMQQAMVKVLPILQKTILALGSAVLMARVFMNSGVNASELASMPLTSADGIAAAMTGKPGPCLPFGGHHWVLCCR
ncbi:MAG: hypothetical protein AAGA46_06990 [Cyanobacteria bacterium P01_F01_bin.13]